LSLHGDFLAIADNQGRGVETKVGILWIILIVILVLALLGFFSRGYW
jgi:flagellar basal body-associated protein FliL